jgi:hypothetical protein
MTETLLQAVVFSVSRDGRRWRVLVDGQAFVTTADARVALSTASEAVQILRRAGLSANLQGPTLAWEAPRGRPRR